MLLPLVCHFPLEDSDLEGGRDNTFECIFSVPVEWFTLRFNMPFMMLLTDIRQGIFYAFLLCFWIIFTGEHMMVRHC